MKLMAEILEEFQHKSTTPVQEIQRKVDPETEETHKELMRLNPNIAKVMTEYAKFDPKTVKQTKLGSHHMGAKVCGNSVRYQVTIAPVRKKPTDLVVYECSQCGVFSAWYASFDSQNNKCIKRQLLGES